MTNFLTVATLAAGAALFSLAAQAQDGGLTRAQVTAELQQARASGALERMYSEGFGLPQPLLRGEAARLAAGEARPAAAEQAQAGQASQANVKTARSQK